MNTRNTRLRASVAAAAVATLALLGGGGARAQREAATPQTPISTTGTPPDVQVVIMPLPTGQWGVSAVYPKKVPRAEAQARLKRLVGLTGWKESGVEFEDRALERVPNDKYKFAALPVMSSLTFYTTGNVVDLAGGTIPIEPFARAYRDLSRVHVTYLVPMKFNFRGLRRFSDGNLDVSLSEGQGAWTYVLNIKNHKLESLGLPRYETLKSTQGVQSADAGAAAAARRRLVGTGLVVLLAAGAGTLAWAWTNRLAAR